MRITKILFLCTILFANQAIAKQESEQIVVKLKGTYTSENSKQTGLPTPTTRTGAVDPGKLFATAYGIEASLAAFFTDHIAAEFSTGLTFYRAKGSASVNIANNYPSSSAPGTVKGRNIKAVPSALIAQYHIAPYGALRPYLGVGYHYTYFLPGNQYKMDNGKGFVLQAGLDFVLMDDTYVSLDIKRYSLETKVKYKTSIASANGKPVTAKVKLNPIVVGLGIGFRL